jgi:hypothetical protein
MRNNPECREVILTLGCFDDFTGYALDAVRDWPDANEIVFDLAKKTRADGKVDAVRRLEARTEEIRDWIIKRGCENRVHNGYLALTCAEKGGLVTYLRRKNLDDECFDGICVIIHALIEEGDMRFYKRHRDAVKLFVRHAGRRDLSIENLRVLLKVYRDYRSGGKNKRDKKHPAIRKKCASALRSWKYREKIISALKDGISDSWPAERRARFALRLAEFLKMDITALLFDLVKHDPAEYHDYLRTLYADPEYAAKTTAVYEEWVENAALVKGMDDAPFLFVESIQNRESGIAHLTLDRLLPQLRDTSLSGVKIVKAGLSSPVSTDRRGACGVLFNWRKTLGKNLSEFSPELWEHVNAIAGVEVNAELIGYCRNLLQKA